MQVKHCPRCDRDLEVTEFHRNPRTGDGLKYICKACASEYERLWRLANPGRDRENLRQWRRRNPDKARWHGRAQHNRNRTAVFNHYGWSCACCGSTGRPTIDHIDGNGREHRAEAGIATGTRTYLWLVANGFPEGFQTLCIPCNRSKGTGPACRLVHATESSQTAPSADPRPAAFFASLGFSPQEAADLAVVAAARARFREDERALRGQPSGDGAR